MEPNEKQFYAQRLENLWGRYLSFVNFAITISGGTVLVLMSKLIELKVEQKVLESVPALAWVAMILAIFSTLYGIVWRALSQRFMEYEILTPFASMLEYLNEGKRNCYVTDPSRFERGPRNLFRLLMRLAPWAVSGSIAASWFCIGIHLSQLL